MKKKGKESKPATKANLKKMRKEDLRQDKEMIKERKKKSTKKKK